MVKLESARRKISVTGVCPLCGKSWIVPDVDLDGYLAWRDGALIQQALPDMSPRQRELLISGTCDDCWNDMCKFLEEDDDEEIEL